MSLNFESVKKRNSRTRDLIFGYFRDSHDNYFISDNPYYSLQPLIVYTCIAYYFKHEWDTEIVSDRIQIKGGTVTKTKRGTTTVLIKDEISSGKHEYEIRIIECKTAVKERCDIIFGIIDDKILKEKHASFVHDWIFWRGYYYVPTDGDIVVDLDDDVVQIHDRKYRDICKNGDVMKLRMNLDDLEMEYFINDAAIATIKPIKKAVYNIGVYLYCKDTIIELL